MNAKQIAEIIENSEYNYFGLRSMTPNYYGGNDTVAEIGGTLPASYIWDDNESTGETLNGTSAVDVTDNHIDEALNRLDCYDGRQVALLGSYLREYGEDADEIIMRNPIVLAVWSK